MSLRRVGMPNGTEFRIRRGFQVSEMKGCSQALIAFESMCDHCQHGEGERVFFNIYIFCVRMLLGEGFSDLPIFFEFYPCHSRRDGCGIRCLTFWRPSFTFKF